MLINILVSHLRSKFKSQLQELKLEIRSDEYGEYILLHLIIIKKSQQKMGYGSRIIYEIVKFADQNNVRIKILPINRNSIKLDWLYQFYCKQGFITINNIDMIYIPKNCNKYICNVV